MSRPDYLPNCMALSSKMEPCPGYSEIRIKLNLEEKENERMRTMLESIETTARLAMALREEIVRQYRDDDRRKCAVGAAFWEEEVQPMLLAKIAISFIQQHHS